MAILPKDSYAEILLKFSLETSYSCRQCFPNQHAAELGSILRSPALAVVAAYALRMFLVWLTNQNEGIHPKLQVMGLEEGRVAWSLATEKGFLGPFPRIRSPDRVARPGWTRSCGQSA